MDKDYFMNTGISPWSELNCASDQSFFDPNTSDHFSQHFDSSLSSGMSNDVFALRELIGKLGGGGGGIGSCSNTFPNDCGSSLNSPNKLSVPALDHQMNIPNLGNSVTLAPPLPSLAADPGFAERAAKFSCFGSRSFNGRTSQLGQSGNGELGIRSNSPLTGNGKLSRVLSSPALKQGASTNKQMEIPRPGPNSNNGVVLGSEKKFSKLSGSNANSSNEDSSVSEQIPSGETGSKVSNEMNSRKRKVGTRGKHKEDGSNSAKGVEGGDAKRSKSTDSDKMEEETRGGSNDESDKQKGNQKPLPEPPKDYIHVRARRGQATDSHSLAERVRREKISERMKLLQDLVPGCNKVTGKALMLDEIINYVQSLQHQVEFLSMKLSSVNPSLDVNMESLLSKDMFQQNAITMPQQQMYPLDSSSSPAFYHHQQQQQNVQQLQHNGTSIPSGPMSHCHLPSVDGFNETLSQFSSFNEDDLQSIVQMGFVQNTPPNFPVLPSNNNMKVER